MAGVESAPPYFQVRQLIRSGFKQAQQGGFDFMIIAQSQHYGKTVVQVHSGQLTSKEPFMGMAGNMSRISSRGAMMADMVTDQHVFFAYNDGEEDEIAGEMAAYQGGVFISDVMELRGGISFEESAAKSGLARALLEEAPPADIQEDPELKQRASRLRSLVDGKVTEARKGWTTRLLEWGQRRLAIGE